MGGDALGFDDEGAVVCQPALTGQTQFFGLGKVVNPGEVVGCEGGFDGGLAGTGDDSVAFEAGADGGEGGFFDVVVAEEEAVLAVEEGVATNEGVFHLPVAVEGAVWDAVDQSDGGAEAVAFEILQVVVEDLVVLADDANAAGLFLFVAEEDVLFNDAAVAVAEGEGAGDFEEGVGAVDVATGFVGDAFGLAVALVEEVFLDETGGFLHGGVAVSNA